MEEGPGVGNLDRQDRVVASFKNLKLVTSSVSLSLTTPASASPPLPESSWRCSTLHSSILREKLKFHLEKNVISPSEFSSRARVGGLNGAVEDTEEPYHQANYALCVETGVVSSTLEVCTLL